MQSLQGALFGAVVNTAESFSLVNPRTKKTCLSLNHEHIVNATGNKQDIILTYQGLQEQSKKEDCLQEIRMFVQEPYREDQSQDSKEEDQEQQCDQFEEEGQEVNKKKRKEKKPKKEKKLKKDEPKNYAQQLLKDIVSKSQVQKAVGDVIATLQDVNLVVPRGKFTLNFYCGHIGLHGVKYSHKVEYSNITRGLFLPSNNESFVSIVLCLTKSVSLGLSQHDSLNFMIAKDILQKDIKINKEVLINQKKIDKADSLEQSYEGSQLQIIVDLLKKIAGISLIQPGNAYRSGKGQPSIKASIKAQTGEMYPLNKSIVFVHKPTIYLRHSDIQRVDFLRASTTNRLFDLKFNIKSYKKPLELGSIDKEEIERLDEYFKERQLEVLRDQTPKVRMIDELDEAIDEQNESEDEDFNEADAKQQSSSNQEEDQEQKMIEESEEEEMTGKKKKKVQN